MRQEVIAQSSLSTVHGEADNWPAVPQPARTIGTDHRDGAAAGEGDDALAMLYPYRARDLLSVPFSRSFQSTDISRGGEVRNIYRKIKKNVHKPLSPASVDKSVHKFAPPSKYSTFLYLHEVNA